MPSTPTPKKTLLFKFHGQTLQFAVSDSLFSSFHVDTGTQLLLRTVADLQPRKFRKVLDLGCGYGPIGLTLLKTGWAAETHMTDRDALAIEYTRRNAETNGVAGATVYGSLGYDSVKDPDFDLVISNIPAKAGDAAITSFLLGARKHLRADGMAAVVVVERLHDMVAGALAGDPGREVTHVKQGSGHTAFHYRFAGDGPDGGVNGDDDPYLRAEVQFSYGKASVHMRIAFGLPEFDTLSFQSRLLIAGLRNLGAARSGAFFNPGQGHTAVAALKALGLQSVTLFDRDLLALRYTKDSLVINGLPADSVATVHSMDIDPTVPEAGFDLVAGALREDEGTDAAVARAIQAAAVLGPSGTLLIAGGSTLITRLQDALRSNRRPLRLVDRQREKGYSLLIMKLKETGGPR
ncbi:MAG: methyltransferase [SAR202 cluster bacterium]|nr:methyltransferase [SAR202 cluster bacterium]